MAASTFLHRSIKIGDAKDLDLNGQDILNPGINTFTKIKTGNFVGDGTTNRAIPHGLGRVPISVFASIITAGSAQTFQLFDTIHWNQGGYSVSVDTVTASDSTNFYVSGSFVNINGKTIYWMAI